jgi:hypothetical protein
MAMLLGSGFQRFLPPLETHLAEMRFDAGA